MAEPLEAHAIGAHERGVFGTKRSVASHHAKFFGKFLDVGVIFIVPFAVLVIDLHIGLLWNTNEGVVGRVLEIENRRPL